MSSDHEYFTLVTVSDLISVRKSCSRLAVGLPAANSAGLPIADRAPLSLSAGAAETNHRNERPAATVAKLNHLRAAGEDYWARACSRR
jgi:hypothetical protein